MRDVLVLDRLFVPQRIVSLRRACELLVCGKAVPVSDDAAGVMRSPSLELEVPLVIQVQAVAKWIYTAHTHGCSRNGILARDRHQCQFVINGEPCPRRGDTIDHLHPASLGGPWTWTNLVGACRHHNAMKQDRTLDEMAAFGWTLRRPPVAPARTIRMLNDAGVHTVPDAWMPFLAV